MRFKWLTVFLLVVCCIFLSRYIRPALTTPLSPSFKLCEGFSANARYLLNFQDLTSENKKLKGQIDSLTGELIRLEEAARENERLRSLLSFPQEASYKTRAALLIGKDSSNWTKTVLLNKGASSGIKEGLVVTSGPNLVGRIIEAAPFASRASLLIDFNSKIPAKIRHSREEGIVFGDFYRGKSISKMKYLQEVEIGDEVISSGLGGVYPKGLLIGKVIRVEEEKNRLYKVAEIRPAVDFSRLEEVTVIIEQ